MKVLIAEDAPDVASVVAFGVHILWPGCDVLQAADGAEALRFFMMEQPDLAILDVEMPPPDGFAVCQHIRSMSQIPILMLTVRGSVVDKLRAFELGADDYLTKPFDHLELFARLRALVRRSVAETPAQDAPPSPSFTLGDFSLDFATETVRIQGDVVPLTAIEYRLLAALVRHAGSVLPHQFLLEQVWGPAYVGDTHYLKVFVGRLRHKLHDDAERPRYIHTVWGTGYRFTPPHA